MVFARSDIDSHFGIYTRVGHKKIDLETTILADLVNVSGVLVVELDDYEHGHDPLELFSQVHCGHT